MNLTENLASQKKQFKLWKSWSESQLEERKVFKNELFFCCFLKTSTENVTYETILTGNMLRKKSTGIFCLLWSK